VHQPNSARPTLHGFTLLELSIVLAIIGLLVGSMLGFRSYTRNAAITAMMNDSKLLIQAFQQFQTTYTAPPGDYSTASSTWTGAGNGDGNGLIRAAAVAVPLERYYAFQHLALAGLIQGRYTGAANAGGGATIGVNVQGTPVDKSAFIFDHPDALDGFVSADALYFDGQYGNILRIAGLNDNATSIPDQAFLTGKQALNIDEKYDDAIPGTGMIVTPKTSALTSCTSSATAYTTTTDGKACYLFVRIQ
jgi:prepilin-type N-terminal cleavage/methylation domain-containing protein